MTIIFPYIGGSTPGGGGGGDLDIRGSALIDVSTSGTTARISSKTFVYEQGVASDTWVIEHNLNKLPSITLVDSAGTVFQAAVLYNDLNKCTILLNGLTTGKAYLN